MAVAQINPDYQVLVSVEEIEALDAAFDNKVKGEHMSYEDLLLYYKDRTYEGEGLKLKSVLSGNFTPKKLGLKNTNRNSKVLDVIQCYKNRIQNTLDSTKKVKVSKDLERFFENGVYGSQDTWYIHVSTDGGNIPLGPFKTVNQASSVKSSIDSYRKGDSLSINDAKIVLKSNRIHPKIIELLTNTFPDQE